MYMKLVKPDGAEIKAERKEHQAVQKPQEEPLLQVAADGVEVVRNDKDALSLDQIPQDVGRADLLPAVRDNLKDSQSGDDPPDGRIVRVYAEKTGEQAEQCISGCRRRGSLRTQQGRVQRKVLTVRLRSREVRKEAQQGRQKLYQQQEVDRYQLPEFAPQQLEKIAQSGCGVLPFFNAAPVPHGVEQAQGTFTFFCGTHGCVLPSCFSA